MAILKVLSVYDSKAEAFLPPFTAQTTAVGIRMFTRECQNPESQFHIHAGDYTLFQLAEFDDDDGRMIPHEQAINLGLAITFISSEPTAVAGGE